MTFKLFTMFFLFALGYMSQNLYAEEKNPSIPPDTAITNTLDSTKNSAVEVQKITIEKSAVKILTNGKLNSFSTFRLAKPARLVIDLPRVTNKLSDLTYSSQTAAVSSIKVVSYMDKLRLIIEATDSQLFPESQIDSNATGLVINIAENIRQFNSTPSLPHIPSDKKPTFESTSAKPRTFGAITSKGHIASVSVDYKPDTTRIIVVISGNCAIHDPQIVLNGISASFEDCIVPTNWQGAIKVMKDHPAIKAITLFPANATKNVDAGILIETRKKAKFSFSKDKQFLVVDVERPLIPEPTVHSDTKQKSAVATMDLAAVANNTNSTDKGFTGKRVTMEFDNADLRQIFRLLGEVSGDNIIIGDDVKGNYTIKLKEVPWDQALQMILVNNSLEIERYGNVIEVVTYDKIKKRRDQNLERSKQIFEQKREEERMRTIGQAVDNKSDEIVTAQCYVQNTTAADILPVLSILLSKYRAVLGSSASINTTKTNANVTPQSGGVLGGGGISGEATFDKSTTYQSQSTYKAEYGEMFPEANTNTIIINDRMDVIRKAESIISVLDVAKKQVMIEARMVEASTLFTKNLGVQWGMHFRDGSASLLGINSLDSGFGGITAQAPTSGTSGPGMATGISFGTLASNINLDVRLSAAASMGTIKILSSPKIVTSYGTTATITQGQQIPYTATTANVTDTKFITAALKLDVTPKITPSGNVLLDLKISNDSAGTGSPPSINTKQATTQITIPNNETAVIGGIITDSVTDSNDGVPFLMNIPLLGNLFKSTSSSKVQTEMLIFLTPRLLDKDKQISNVKTECKIIK